MKRNALKFLNEWFQSNNRKPLVIRGARQVGKTWLVRQFAQTTHLNLIEINFEKTPQLASFFQSNDIPQILLNLSAHFNVTIKATECLLFLDEIQVVPELLSKLRWFAEEFAELPVIAAGSLLEFVLEKHSFSMPVGRINDMHLEPLSFEEFLLANNKNVLIEFLKMFDLKTVIPMVIHSQLMQHFKEYVIVGGMPAAVLEWINQRNFKGVNQIHHDLLATYRDDFAKYSGRLSTERLDEVMLAVPKYLGEKFVYTRVKPSIQISPIKQSLDLLCRARICHKVMGSSANGVPLGAEIQEKYFKVIFLDVGLCSAALGLSLDQLYMIDEINVINRGGISEQVVGQLLRTLFPFYIEPTLYCWHREEKGSSAEVDYVMAHQNQIIPIEVKSGSTGSLKSLHGFMSLKNLPLAVRINSDVPTQTDVKMKDYQGKEIQYSLISLPFYLIGQLTRLTSR